MAMSSETPLVSVICPTYNHEKYIRQTLNGFVIQQCNFPIEVIVHDDASTDNTATIIREYTAKYPFIRAILQTENMYSQGLIRWEYLLIQEAKGKYVAVCDGDDYWIDPLKLQRQVDFLEANPDYGLVYTKAKCYLQKQNKFKGSTGSDFNTFEDLLLKNVVPTLTVVVRKNLYAEYFNEVNPYEQKWLLGDWPAWLWFAKNSKIRYENYVTGVYRVLPGSVSHSDDYEKMYRFSRSGMSVVEYFINRYGIESKNTLQDVALLKTWPIFKLACLYNKEQLFDEVQVGIGKIKIRYLSLPLLYMKLVLFCRPMRYLFIIYKKVQGII